MAKVNEKIVVAVLYKNKMPGEKGWAAVWDADNWEEFKEWFKTRSRDFKHLAHTWEGDFKNLNELIKFKKLLKNMLQLEELDFEPTDEELDWFADMNADMYHYDEGEFDKV